MAAAEEEEEDAAAGEEQEKSAMVQALLPRWALHELVALARRHE